MGKSLDEQIEMMLPEKVDIRKELISEVRKDFRAVCDKYCGAPWSMIASPFLAATTYRQLRDWSSPDDDDTGGDIVRTVVFAGGPAMMSVSMAQAFAQTYPEHAYLSFIPIATNIASVVYETARLAREYVESRIALLKEKHHNEYRETLRTALTSPHIQPLDENSRRALEDFSQEMTTHQTPEDSTYTVSGTAPQQH